MNLKQTLIALVFCTLTARLVPQDEKNIEELQLSKGKQIFFETACSACHGDEGRGDGPAAVALAPKPQDFVLPFKYGESEKEISRTISQGVTGTAMAPYRKTLTKKKIALLAKYIIYLRDQARKSREE